MAADLELPAPEVTVAVMSVVLTGIDPAAGLLTRPLRLATSGGAEATAPHRHPRQLPDPLGGHVHCLAGAGGCVPAWTFVP
jgi:hypothetical protein